MVFDTHKKVIAFFSGACARDIYDKVQTAVNVVFVSKERL